jgi:hydroxymethylbilane synthase
MTRTLRLGTRPSALAVAQSELVAQRLRAAGHDVELVTVSTSGDRSSAPIATLGVGVFVSQLRDALVADEVDLAVHSYKDLPTAPDPRLHIAAIPTREDPRDALVARDGLVLGALPPGARVGTGSPRRTAQLRALGLGLEVVPIRGNVDTRIGKVRSGELDAVVVAAAGLRRLGRVDEATELLDPLQMLPAPAQGALAVECRVEDLDLVRELAATLDDEVTRAAVTAERALLAALEAGCSAPVGALADVVSDWVTIPGSAGGDDDGRVLDRLSLRGVLGTPDGGLLRATGTADIDEAEKLGAALAAELLDLGGAFSPPANR